MPEDNPQQDSETGQTRGPIPATGGSQQPSTQTGQPTSSEADPRQEQASKPTVFTAPPAMVNGQPFQPITQKTDGQFDQLPDRKPSKWRYVFIVLGILQAAGVALFFLIMIWAGQQAKAGVSGTEFIALILFVTLVPAVTLIAAINLIGLPIYLIKHKPQGKGLVLSIVSLLISLILGAYGAYNAFSLTYYPDKRAEESRQKFAEQEKQFATDNAKPEIIKEEAVQLLNACQLKGFYYTAQTDKSDPANGNWGELSTTGVVLTKVDGKPYRISIADRLIPELVPIARNAQKSCGGGPQFWHDGSYEQFKDGKWYFKGEVVNDVQSGKTEEEAISFMQACKADYFVGYTDINLVKDANTKAWLTKAEQSNSGIEISENAPKSYVFASKAMTASLQDTARQFRQSCYSTKKLYVTIDNWVETEYPVGKWTKVQQ